MKRIDGSFYTLTVKDELALMALLDIVFSTNLFVKDDDSDNWVRTTGETINLESLQKSDYDVLRKMNEELNGDREYEYID